MDDRTKLKLVVNITTINSKYYKKITLLANNFVEFVQIKVTLFNRTIL